MIPVISGVKNIRLLQQPELLQPVHNGINQFVNRLQRPQALAIEMVVELHVGIGQFGEGADPVCP
jgi:hypothetical protein